MDADQNRNQEGLRPHQDDEQRVVVSGLIDLQRIGDDAREIARCEDHDRNGVQRHHGAKRQGLGPQEGEPATRPAPQHELQDRRHQKKVRLDPEAQTGARADGDREWLSEIRVPVVPAMGKKQQVGQPQRYHDMRALPEIPAGRTTSAKKERTSQIKRLDAGSIRIPAKGRPRPRRRP